MTRIAWPHGVGIAMALAFLTASPLATAQTVAHAEALFASKICFACHSVTRDEVKRLGPYVADIAERYRGRPDAADALRRKVLQGSAGTWGPPDTSVMPANHVTEEEARALVEWILAK